MENELELDPNEQLFFTGPFSELVNADFYLKNRTDKLAYFRVKTTAPQYYSALPNSGIVLPRSESLLVISLKAFESNPNETKGHKLMVQSVLVPNDEKVETIEDLWKKTPKENLIDLKLRCVLVFPEEKPITRKILSKKNSLSLQKQLKETIMKDLEKLVDDVYRTNELLIGEFEVTTKESTPGIIDKLHEAQATCEELQKYIQDNLQDIKKVNDDEPKKTNNTKKKSPQLTPQEQELSYELKAQMMRQIDVQNAKIKTELQLHGKRQELKVANEVNRSLHDEWRLSRMNSLKLLKMFENKAKDANTKVNQLHIELQKSKLLAKKYQDMYEAECRNNGHQPVVQSTRSSTSEKSEPENENKLLNNSQNIFRRPVTAPGHRLPDYQRRFEVLLVENESLRNEISRLHSENVEFTKTVKHAKDNADVALHHLNASEMARKDLHKKYSKQQKEHVHLERSLTRQANDWVRHKKKMKSLEQEYKWGQVNPVTILGNEQRTYTHVIQKNTNQPRMMYPVTNYAKANQTE